MRVLSYRACACVIAPLCRGTTVEGCRSPSSASWRARVWTAAQALRLCSLDATQRTAQQLAYRQRDEATMPALRLAPDARGLPYSAIIYKDKNNDQSVASDIAGSLAIRAKRTPLLIFGDGALNKCVPRRRTLAGRPTSPERCLKTPYSAGAYLRRLERTKLPASTAVHCQTFLAVSTLSLKSSLPDTAL